MKGKVILLVTALVAIGLTIAIYNLAVTEWTSMIRLSLAVVCVSELAVVCTMGLLPVLNFKNGSTGILVNIYAALMIAWSLIGCNFDGNTFPIGLLVISAVMLVIIGMSLMGSHESDRLNDEVEQSISQKQTFTSAAPQTIPSKHTVEGTSSQDNLASMWLVIQSSVEDYDTRKNLRIVIERIQAMPANKFPNPTIENSMRQITAMCRALSKTDDVERMNTRINTKVKELSNYIKSL